MKISYRSKEISVTWVSLCLKIGKCFTNLDTEPAVCAVQFFKDLLAYYIFNDKECT